MRCVSGSAMMDSTRSAPDIVLTSLGLVRPHCRAALPRCTAAHQCYTIFTNRTRISVLKRQCDRTLGESRAVYGCGLLRLAAGGVPGHDVALCAAVGGREGKKKITGLTQNAHVGPAV